MGMALRCDHRPRWHIILIGNEASSHRCAPALHAIFNIIMKSDALYTDMYNEYAWWMRRIRSHHEEHAIAVRRSIPATHPNDIIHAHATSIQRPIVDNIGIIDMLTSLGTHTTLLLVYIDMTTEQATGRLSARTMQ